MNKRPLESPAAFYSSLQTLIYLQSIHPNFVPKLSSENTLLSTFIRKIDSNKPKSRLSPI